MKKQTEDAQSTEQVKQINPTFVKLVALSSKEFEPAPDTPTSDKVEIELDNEEVDKAADDKEGTKDAELLLSKCD